MSGSVSMVDGHIDPDKNEITPQQAIKYFEDEILMLENAPNLNGCEMTNEWREQLEICKMAKQAIEKQIPKKPIENKYKGIQANYILFACPNCKQEFQLLEDITGVCSEQEQPFCCIDCGQKIDWSDTE